jgi:hypothetical protein
VPAQIRSGQKKALLSAIYNAVRDDSFKDVVGSLVSITSLQDGLLAYQAYLMSQGDAFRGKFSTASTGFGHSVQYSTALIWRATNEETLFELSQDFLDLFDDAVAANNSATDETLFEWMKAQDELNAPDRTLNDMTVIRYQGSRYA